jgi:gamma-D-glutamyl-L-lysine dipeptidyl-peptidase
MPRSSATTIHIASRSRTITSTAPRRAWVDVAVATVWNKPTLVRPVDRAAVGANPQPTRWLEGLTYPELLDLDNRVATQALLYDPLVVESVTGRWAHVLVTEQTGSVYRHGIEGWVPLAQLTFAPPPSAHGVVTVAVPEAPAGSLELSYGTRLPLLAEHGRTVIVGTPSGPSAIPYADTLSRAPAPSGPSVVRQAERFLGLAYMWAGTSAFGFDCSGLTYMVYRQFGVHLARDAADQSLQGAAVARSHLLPGDLVFFAWGGVVDHVGIYAGGGKMIDAPKTGGRVELTNLWSSPIAANYAGARRYLVPSGDRAIS